MVALPLFPLPNVVLFPGVLLPLHIFEPRYRALTADALGSDRRLGIVLLRSGWKEDYEGRPPIHDVGTVGVIENSARLDDGRYNIVLRGIERFRIVSENHELTYRRAAVAPLSEAELDEADRKAVGELRAALHSHLGLPADASLLEGGSAAAHLLAMADAEFVHYVSQYLDLEPIEKQALLERDSLRHRTEALVELVEMKKLERSMAIEPGISH
jgi:uncharacterized protein